jgi:hypothetical protein
VHTTTSEWSQRRRLETRALETLCLEGINLGSFSAGSRKGGAGTSSRKLEYLPGRPLIHKLRVIHLLEADLNLSLGIIWNRRLMAQGEKLGVFGDEQWSTRTGRCANTVVLLKHLTYEMMHLTKTDGGTFDNDAKACFDRIIPALTNLRSRQLGVPASACHTHAE